MSNKVELILYLTLLVILLYFAGKLAWKYSPRFVSQRERRGLSDWEYGKKRWGMVGSTCVVFCFVYFFVFIDPLEKKMKAENDNKQSTSDTTVKNIKPKNTLNKHEKTQRIKHPDLSNSKTIYNHDIDSEANTNVEKRDTLKRM